MQFILIRWQRCYRAEIPEHADVALFRSLNMSNSAALMPAGVGDDVRHRAVGFTLGQRV